MKANLKSSVAANPNLRSEVADIYRQQWWVRCLLQTENDKLGLILRAAMGLPTNDPPWLGPSAIIDDKGMVLSNYVGTDNRPKVGESVCHINELVDNLRRLVEHLRLSDTEAYALFDKVKGWIKQDCRPNTEQAEDRVPIEYRRVN